MQRRNESENISCLVMMYTFNGGFKFWVSSACGILRDQEQFTFRYCVVEANMLTQNLHSSDSLFCVVIALVRSDQQ